MAIKHKKTTMSQYSYEAAHSLDDLIYEVEDDD